MIWLDPQSYGVDPPPLSRLLIALGVCIGVLLLLGYLTDWTVRPVIYGP